MKRLSSNTRKVSETTKKFWKQYYPKSQLRKVNEARKLGAKKKFQDNPNYLREAKREIQRKYRFKNKAKTNEWAKKHREKISKLYGKGKRRLNPITGKRFVKGNVREDGKIFYQYHTNSIKKDGYQDEYWLLPKDYLELIKKIKSQYNKKKLANLKRIKEGNISKRLNPKTGKEFESGYVREDGNVFLHYRVTEASAKSKYARESWLSPEAFKKRKISDILHGARVRSKEKKLKLNLDREYLIGIFPKDSICPILNKKMIWGSGVLKNNSISLDRIIPEKGYTRGNVRFVSHIANTLKSNRNMEVIEKIYFDMKKILKI